MRTKIVTIVVLVLIGFTSCDKDARERRKKLEPIAEESITSLVNAVDGIQWNNHNPPGPDIEDTDKPCYQTLINVIGLMPKLKVNKDDLDEILKIYDFSKLIQEPVDAGKFDEIEGHDLDRRLFPHPIRDRILRKIDIDLENEDFVRQVRGNGNLSEEDKDDLHELYPKFHNDIKGKRITLAVASRQIANCSFADLLLIRLSRILPDERSIAFAVKRQITFVCDCNDEMGQDMPKYGYIQFESTLKANYEEKGLYNLVFGNATRPEITGMNIVCCGNAEEEYEDQEDEYQQHQEGGH